MLFKLGPWNLYGESLQFCLFFHHQKVPGYPGLHPTCLVAFSFNCQSLCHQLGLGLGAGGWLTGLSDRVVVVVVCTFCELTTTEMMLLLSFSKYNRFLEFQVTGKLSTFAFKSVLKRLKQNEKYKTNHFALKNYTQVFIYYCVILTVYIIAVTLKKIFLQFTVRILASALHTL